MFGEKKLLTEALYTAPGGMKDTLSLITFQAASGHQQKPQPQELTINNYNLIPCTL